MGTRITVLMSEITARAFRRSGRAFSGEPALPPVMLRGFADAWTASGEAWSDGSEVLEGESCLFASRGPSWREARSSPACAGTATGGGRRGICCSNGRASACRAGGPAGGCRRSRCPLPARRRTVPPWSISPTMRGKRSARRASNMRSGRLPCLRCGEPRKRANVG